MVGCFNLLPAPPSDDLGLEIDFVVVDSVRGRFTANLGRFSGILDLIWDVTLVLVAAVPVNFAFAAPSDLAVLGLVRRFDSAALDVGSGLAGGFDIGIALAAELERGKLRN